jgi:hypothetical protein
VHRGVARREIKLRESGFLVLRQQKSELVLAESFAYVVNWFEVFASMLEGGKSACPTLLPLRNIQTFWRFEWCQNLINVSGSSTVMNLNCEKYFHEEY